VAALVSLRYGRRGWQMRVGRSTYYGGLRGALRYGWRAMRAR
jgi:hypothetical protein